MTADAGFVQTSQGRLYHEMAGDGPPLVLIHGGLWDARMWDDQFEAFAQRRSVLRYDLRGFGRSERPTGPFSNTQDLTELLQHLGIERTAVLGLSMGGRVAIDFTLERPEMVSALIPVAAGLGGFEYEDAELEKRWHELEAAIEAGDIDRAVDIELEIWAPLPTDPDAERRCRAIAHQNTFELTMDESWPRHIDPPAVGRLGETRVPTLV